MAKKKKINFSTVEVKFNSTHVAPKMTTVDWDEVNACIETIQDVGRRAGHRIHVSSKYNIVHLADPTEDPCRTGDEYWLLCGGQLIYTGFVSNWNKASGQKVTCERCLMKLGKITIDRGEYK